MNSLSQLLAPAGVLLFDTSEKQQLAVKRKDLTRLLGENFEAFDLLRRHLAGGPDYFKPRNDLEARICYDLLEHRLIREVQQYHFKFATAEASQYLSGHWLEEYAWLAILEAGVDEATFGQQMEINLYGWTRQREIDVLARKGEKVFFVSCKCYRAYLYGLMKEKKKQALQDAMAEIDDLQENLGNAGDKAILLTSTDLIDEAAGYVHRYPKLAKQSKNLGVELIGLDHLRWDDLKAKFEALLG